MGTPPRWEEGAVAALQRYLRVNTMQPAPDYGACVAFLSDVAASAGLPCRVVEVCAPAAGPSTRL